MWSLGYEAAEPCVAFCRLGDNVCTRGVERRFDSSCARGIYRSVLCSVKIWMMDPCQRYGRLSRQLTDHSSPPTRRMCWKYFALSPYMFCGRSFMLVCVGRVLFSGRKLNRNNVETTLVGVVVGATSNVREARGLYF